MIKISPNPSITGLFNISFTKSNNSRYNLKLYNSIGELIFVKTIIANNDNNEEIDISKYAKGVYYLHINSENNSKVYKLIYSN